MPSSNDEADNSDECGRDKINSHLKPLSRGLYSYPWCGDDLLDETTLDHYWISRLFTTDTLIFTDFTSGELPVHRWTSDQLMIDTTISGKPTPAALWAIFMWSFNSRFEMWFMANNLIEHGDQPKYYRLVYLVVMTNICSSFSFVLD